MCILFINANPNPVPGGYRLILASNRDEYLIRNAEPAHKWSEDTNIISERYYIVGIDLEPGREGGTWLGMGVGQALRVGALLNMRGEPRIPSAPGRGFIVTDYLKNKHVSTEDFFQNLKFKGHNFNAFNFVGVEIAYGIGNVTHYSNVNFGIVSQFEPNVPLGFGNSLPEVPFTKVVNGKQQFENIIKKYKDILQRDDLIRELLQLLKWNERHLPDEELQRRAPEAVEYLSSIFVSIPQAGYGTRTHTLILVDYDGNVDYIEDTMECPINVDNPKWLSQCIQTHL